MSETRQVKLPKKKEKRKEAGEAPSVGAAEKKRKLKELDELIEGVLEQAGEEFLDEFKQIEGQ